MGVPEYIEQSCSIGTGSKISGQVQSRNILAAGLFFQYCERRSRTW